MRSRVLGHGVRALGAVAGGVAAHAPQPESLRSSERFVVRCDKKAAEGPLHRYDPELAERGRAPNPGRVGKLRAPKETQVVRIVMTGGPCAGKSSVMGRLIEVASSRGYDVYTAPEMATVLLNCGFSFPVDPGSPGYDAQLYAFQKNLVKLILQMERSATAIAASTGRPSIIVFDRGLLDCAGYMPEEMWKRVLDEVDEGRGVTEEYVLKRYDAVVHLVTAADGARNFYKWGDVKDDSGRPTFRKESPEEAVELDKRMQYCWRRHQRHFIIHNTDGGFDEKLRRATEAILSIAQAVHPQAIR